MGGRELELSTASSSTVKDLKLSIEESWSILPECQRLAIGARQLSDGDALGDFCRTGAQAMLTLVVTMASFEEVLDGADRSGMPRWLPKLFACAPKGDGGVQVAAVPLVIAALVHRDTSVVIESSRLLRNLQGSPGTAAGDARAVASACEHLADPAEAVRRAAAMVLGVLAPRGDACAMEALKARFDDPSPGVRCEVLQSWAAVAETANQQTVCEMSRFLRDPDALVGVAAAEALGKLAPDNDLALLAASALMKDSDLTLRKLGVCAMRHVANVGNKFAIGTLRMHVADSSPVMRAYAVSVLAKLTECGDADTVLDLCRCLDDLDAGVRILAMDAIERMAIKGDGHAIAALKTRLHDGDMQVKSHARTTLLMAGAL